jgi:hypothetical protein
MKTWIKWTIGIVISILIGIACIYSIKYIKALQGDIDNLGTINGKLQTKIETLEVERLAYMHNLDSLGKVSYYLGELIQEKDEEIEWLKDSLKKIPEAIAEIPAEESYDWLKVRYPDDEEEVFPFTELQVQSIHIDLASYDLLKGINEKLVDSNTLLKNQVATAELTEAGLLNVIDTYKEENSLLKDSILELRDENIKVKVQRNIAGGIALTTLTILGIVILL